MIVLGADTHGVGCSSSARGSSGSVCPASGGATCRDRPGPLACAALSFRSLRERVAAVGWWEAQTLAGGSGSGAGAALGGGSAAKYPEPSMLICGRMRSSQRGSQIVALPAVAINAGTKKHTTTASTATAVARPSPELLDRGVAVEDEAAEHAEHDQRRRADDAPGVAEPLDHGGASALALLEVLLDLGEQEHLVVGREAEQDREDMINGTKLTTGTAPSRPISPEAKPSWKDEREHAVGGPDRDQVHHGDLGGQHERAEPHQQHEEAERGDDQDDQEEICCWSRACGTRPSRRRRRAST